MTTTRHVVVAVKSARPVSDLVLAMYNDISIEYARLHSASIAVRYGVGLEGYDAAVLTSDFATIATAATNGELTAS